MKKEYDLKKLTKTPKREADPEALKLSVHLRLDVKVILDIKEKAEKLGMPYQTLINSVLTQYCNGGLVSSESIEILKKLLVTEVD